MCKVPIKINVKCKEIMMSSLSIAVVLFNNKDEVIDKIVANISAVTQSLDAVSLFLVNNSPQNMHLREYLEKFDDSTWIHIITPDENEGFGAGNNQVIPFLNNTYHLVMNPDITISDTKNLIAMIDYMNMHKNVGMLTPLIKFPSGETQYLLKHESSVWDMVIRFVKIPGTERRKSWFVNLPNGYSHTHKAENVPGSFMLFRTSVFKQVQGFDEKYFLYMEDCDITMKVNKVSTTMFFADAFVYHEWQRANRKTLRGIFQMISSMFVYFNKWGWKFF